MIRFMTETDVKIISLMHERLFAEYELSAKLGHSYLEKAFYLHLLQSNNGFVKLYEENGRIVAFATGFVDNPAFYRSLRTSYWKIFLATAMLRFVQFKLNFYDLLNCITSRVERATRFKAHLGALALEKDYQKTVKGGIIMKKLCLAVHEELIKRGVVGVYGVTDTRNIPTQRLLKKLGYTHRSHIPMFGKTVELFELEFTND